MKVILAGGGTAGHINPALAIANEIKKHNPYAQFLFVGNKGAMEEDLVAKAGFSFAPMRISGFQRKLSFTNIKRNFGAIYHLMKSPSNAKQILRQFKPDIVIGTGGYVSGPIVYMAAKQGIPTLIHEQNAFPGVTTKLLSKKVDKVLLGAEGAKKYMKMPEKCTVVGNPVRESILLADRESARKHYDMEEDTLCILSFGGSLGAKTLNYQCAKLMEWHAKGKKKVKHIHATGQYGVEYLPELLKEAGVDKDHPNLDIRTYIDDMDRCLAACDLVISRSGAISVSEIAVAGKASVLIPSPNVTANHQYYNAKELADVGGAILIEEKELKDDSLPKVVEALYNDRTKIKALEAGATKIAIFDTNERIYKIIKEMV